VIYYQARKRGFPKREQKIPPRQTIVILREGLVALALPVVMVGGILSGIFTPTEAAVVGVAYSLLVGVVVLRTVRLQSLPGIIGETLRNASPLLLILGMAYLFGWVLGFERVGEAIATFIGGLTTSKETFLLLVIAVVLFAGMWMEVGVIIVIFAPILYPTVLMLGISPIHFGIILILSAVLGVATPPIGICLFAASGVARVPVGEIIQEIWPFLVAQVVVILLLVFEPELVLFLPRMFGLA
jgi:tripartite ATP-independent transporter DctM subunit